MEHGNKHEKEGAPHPHEEGHPPPHSHDGEHSEHPHAEHDGEKDGKEDQKHEGGAKGMGLEVPNVGLHTFGFGDDPNKPPPGKYDLGEPFLGPFNPVVICGWGVSASQAAADAAAEAARKAKIVPPGGPAHNPTGKV